MSNNHFEDLINALNLDKNGEWDAAHKIVQEIKTKEAATIHAYLHRKEGDLENAKYWYNRAESEMPENDLNQEWSDLHNLINKKIKLIDHKHPS